MLDEISVRISDNVCNLIEYTYATKNIFVP